MTTVTQDGGGEPARGDQDQQERRATVRLVHYWSSLRRNHALPAFVDFDPHRNPVPWDNCLLASCRLPREVIYEHVGAELAAIDEGAPDAAGSPPEALPFVQAVTRLLPVVLRTAEVQHVGDGYRRPAGGLVQFRAALLPFRGTREEWTYILGAVTFRIVAEERPSAGRAGARPRTKLGGELPVPPPPGE